MSTFEFTPLPVSASIGGESPFWHSGERTLYWVDIPGHKLAVRLSDKELSERAARWKPPAPRFASGYLAKYASMATSADTGAVLRWK